MIERMSVMNRNRKLNRISKTVISGLLVTSLVVSNGAYANAQKISKDESVYVNADESGTTTKITVSNWLKNAGINGTINDESDLKDIQNVKGDETFTQNGDDVQWSAGSNDIYYQGTTDKELPVGVEIKYELDGKEIAAKDLLGQSGKLKITVSYTNKSKSTQTINGEKQEMYTPFVMATGIILPDDKFSNVEVDDGKIINEGSNNIVVGFGMPGMAESLDLDEDAADKLPEGFTVTADVTDFSIGNTITFASPSILSDLELDDIDDLDDLENKLEKLVDSSEDLVDGSKKLSNKMGELEDKFDDYQNGEKSLNKGIKDLVNGGTTLKKGVKDYTNGVDTLAKGTQSYVNGAKQITDGNQKLYEAVKDMPSSYKEFSDGLQAYTKGVDTLADTKTAKQLTDGADAVTAGIGTLNENLGKLESSYDNYKLLADGLKAQAAQISDPTQKATILAYVQKLEELYQGQKASVGALVSATNKESTLKSGASQVAAGIKKVMTGAQTLSGNSATLRSADQKLTSSIATLTASVKKLSEGSKKLSSNDRKLLAGAKKILKASKSVKSGSDKLINGANKLKKGSNKLHKATGKVADGIGKLSDGADDLYEGMDKFDQKGIQKLNNVYEDDIKTLKTRLEKLTDMSKDYTNFSGISKGMDGKVKFVIETAEVKKDDEQ
jgi:putative membrane protein